MAVCVCVCVAGERLGLEKAAKVHQKWRRKVFRSQNMHKKAKIHVF